MRCTVSRTELLGPLWFLAIKNTFILNERSGFKGCHSHSPHHGITHVSLLYSLQIQGLKDIFQFGFKNRYTNPHKPQTVMP